LSLPVTSGGAFDVVKAAASRRTPKKGRGIVAAPFVSLRR